MDLLTGRAEPPQVNVQVVVSSDTLAGHCDSPGWVPGLGPITAGVARGLAKGPGRQRVRTLVADPETGALTNVAPALLPHPSTQYRLTEPNRPNPSTGPPAVWTAWCANET